MGDFHGTCFASSLPIFAGEDCAAILMAKNPYSSTNNTYPNDRYFPITAPIRGKYDGCGGINPLRDSNFETLEAFVLEKSALLYAKEPALGCEQEILPVPSLSDTLNYAARGELFVNGMGNIDKELNTLLICQGFHQDFFCRSFPGYCFID